MEFKEGCEELSIHSQYKRRKESLQITPSDAFPTESISPRCFSRLYKLM